MRPFGTPLDQAGEGAAAAACALLAALCVLGSARRNRDYRSGISIWSDTIAKVQGNTLAHNNLGLLLATKFGRKAEALAQYETALRLKPDFAKAHNNLGALLVDEPGRKEEALRQFETAVAIDPDFPEAHCNLAGLLARSPGRREEAIAEYREALRLNPGDDAARAALARLEGN